MRTVHPYIAVDGRQRTELNAPLVDLPHTLHHLNLQFALAYTVPQSEADIDEWLDDVIVIHSVGEPRDFSSFYGKISAVERDRTYTLRFHLWEADLARELPARLILEQRHAISDGVGLLTTMDEVLTFLAMTLADPTPASIEWGAEVRRLPPSLQDAIVNPPESWNVTKKELKQI